MGETITSRARSRFLEEVTSIPGVTQVVTYGGETPAERSVVVFVPSLRSEPAQRVFALQGEILREFPGAHLDVAVDGLEELGLTPEMLGDWIPEGADALPLQSNAAARQRTRLAG